MTRKSKREIERELEDLGETGEYSFEEWWMASLKNGHDADLSKGERRLLDDPETHLSEQGKRRYRDVWRST